GHGAEQRRDFVVVVHLQGVGELRVAIHRLAFHRQGLGHEFGQRLRRRCGRRFLLCFVVHSSNSASSSATSQVAWTLPPVYGFRSPAYSTPMLKPSSVMMRRAALAGSSVGSTADARTMFFQSRCSGRKVTHGLMISMKEKPGCRMAWAMMSAVPCWSPE